VGRGPADVPRLDAALRRLVLSVSPTAATGTPPPPPPPPPTAGPRSPRSRTAWPNCGALLPPAAAATLSSALDALAAANTRTSTSTSPPAPSSASTTPRPHQGPRPHPGQHGPPPRRPGRMIPHSGEWPAVVGAQPFIYSACAGEWSAAEVGGHGVRRVAVEVVSAGCDGQREPPPRRNVDRWRPATPGSVASTGRSTGRGRE